MSLPCRECGASTTWAEDAGSSVCTSCGTLVDGSQSVLRSDESVNNPFWDPLSTLKSLHTGWSLAGQETQPGSKQKNYALHDFIRAVASRVNASSLSDRAIFIIDQAMAKGDFRYGQRAKLAAGASIAISLREVRRPDSLQEIALLVDVPRRNLAHTFLEILSLLGIRLDEVDVKSYISNLQTHLTALLDAPTKESGLPNKLKSLLKSATLQNVVNTATTLMDLFARNSVRPEDVRPNLSTTAAAFILAIEGELRDSLQNAGDLSAALGARIHTGKAVIMARYKVLEDLVERWIRDIDWLDQYTYVGKGKKSSVSKRTIVARGMKDALQMQSKLWQEKMLSERRLVLQEFLADESPLSESHLEESMRAMKRRKVNPSLRAAAAFLLNPSGSPVSSKGKDNSISQGSSESLPSFILASSSILTSHHAPSRLQILSSLRGGSTEIQDEELFGENELESLFRSEDEVEALSKVVEWDIPDKVEGNLVRGRKRRLSSSSEMPPVPEFKSSRINEDALDQFMKALDHPQDDDLENQLGFMCSYDGFEGIASDINKQNDEWSEDRYGQEYD